MAPVAARAGGLFLGVPRASGAFAFGFGHRLAGGVAEREQDFPRLVFLFANQPGQRFTKAFQPEIVLASGAFHAVKERGDLDEFVAGVEKIQVEDLLPFHTEFIPVKYTS
jgi:hypothetical protein